MCEKNNVSEDKDDAKSASNQTEANTSAIDEASSNTNLAPQPSGAEEKRDAEDTHGAEALPSESMHPSPNYGNDDSDAEGAEAVQTSVSADFGVPQTNSAGKAAGSAFYKKLLRHKFAIAIAAVVVVAAIVLATLSGGEKASRNEYIDVLNSTYTDIIAAASKAEDISLKTVNIWNSAIFSDGKYEWDEDIQEYYSNDFNDALSKYYSDATTQLSIDSMNDSLSSAERGMKSLSNPPEGCEAVYNEMLDAYTATSRFAKLAEGPSGSYRSYADSFKETQDEVVDCFERITATMPEKEE